MCIRKHVCVCCFVMYDINFVRYETTLQVRMQVCWNSNLKISNSKNGEIIRHKINPKVLSKKRDRLNPPDWSQVTKAGWNMLDSISEKVPRAFRLYSFFAQNIDKSCGAVVCDQKFLADYFGVSLRTIQYWIGDLESIGAIVKIPVGIYYAYALDPYQVWRGYNKSKKYAAFNAKTLTQKDGVIDRKLRLMLSRREEFEGSLKTSNHDLD